MEFKSDLLNTLSERGFIHQCSSFEKLDEILLTQKIKAYIGFDCTAASLHVGSLIQILLLRYLQKFGHTPIALLGAGTTVIGDPTGRDDSRKMLDNEQINLNMQGIKSVLEKFLNFEGNNPAIMLNNGDWLKSLNYLEFLRDFGTHFTINRMLTFDSVKLRLERENPMTFLEFNYMLLQAVDFYHLNKDYGVTLQLGGSDQWGNIINGVELIRRISQKEAFALTSNLVTKSDGSKMGKSANGAVWLSKEMFSPWDFYQYFRNVDDLDVIKYLKLFTELSMTEINTLSCLKGKDLNEAKKILAFEVTKLCHSEEDALAAQKTAINTFEKGDIDDNLPTFYLEYQQIKAGINLVNLLSQFGLTTSNNEARNLIKNKGIKVNDYIIEDIAQIISLESVLQDTIKISVGKKIHILIKIRS